MQFRGGPGGYFDADKGLRRPAQAGVFLRTIGLPRDTFAKEVARARGKEHESRRAIRLPAVIAKWCGRRSVKLKSSMRQAMSLLYAKNAFFLSAFQPKRLYRGRGRCRRLFPTACRRVEGKRGKRFQR